MAIYHNHKSSVQRSKGQNAVASAAYISRSKLTYQNIDKDTGVVSEIVYDYSDMGGLFFSKIYAPNAVAEWVFDRERLWNKAEHVDIRCDARPAHKMILALPKELEPEQQKGIVEDYAEFLISEGIIADINIHYDRENNPHAHIQMTTRELLQLEGDELDFGKKVREWQTIPFLRLQREEWGNIVNRHLEFHGHLDRISHLSHKARGIDLIPGVHQGPANYIKSAELTQLNEEIVKENAAMIRDNPELIFQKLSINKPVFTPEDIAKVLSEVLYSGVEYLDLNNQENKESNSPRSNDIEQLNAKYSTEFMVTYEQLLASKNITLINPCDLKGRKLYALTKRIELEQRYEQTVEQLADSHRHALNVNVEAIDYRTLTEELVEGIYALGREVQTTINEKTGLELNLVAKEQLSLTTEQKQAVVEVLNGSDVSVLEGWPGAGKTHSMRAIVKQYQRAGYKVLGAAPSSAAALTLAKAAGIEAKNIAQWRKSWQEARGVKFELALRSDYYSEAQYQHQLGALDAKTVLIVDEASMVELANMDYLVSEVKKSGAKVVLVGDNNQFAAVGMTGAFKKAGNIAGRSKLTEIMRHQHLDPYIREQQRLATKLVGQYKIPQALAIYHELGVFKIESNAEATKAALVNDYVKEYLEQSDKLKRDDRAAMRSVVIGAYTNVAVNHFNIEVRERLKQAGVLKGAGAKFRCGQETVELFKGEQIVFETNKKARQGFNGVLNGEVATVIDFEQPDKYGHGVFKALVHKADGSKQLVKINTAEEKYPVRFKHGYAVTGYKLQGETVDHMRVYHEPVIGYEAFNVLMSRHKLDVKMYASQEVLEDIVYRRINEDTRVAREKFNIKAYAKSLNQGEADKELPAWYVGLALASSKRVDNNFARDYRAGEVLSDNEQVIKSYLESRELLFNLHGKISEWKERHQQPLKLASLQQQLAQKFVITDAREIVINPNALMFTGNSKVTIEAEGDRVKFSNLSKAEKNSAIWSVLKESSKEELTILFDELKQTRKELRGHADNICRHYNGWVDRELQSKLDDAELNLEDKYLDIKSNWIKAQRNKLGNEVGEGVVNAIANEKTFDRALEVYRDLSKWREGQRSQGKSDSILTAPAELWGKDAQEKWINHLLLTSKESEISETTECGIILATIKELENFEQEKKEALPGIYQLRASLSKAMEGVSGADSKSRLTMGDYMTQLNLNYETVQKHAELSPYKYYLEEIEASGAIASNSNWQEMMKVSEVIIRVQDNRKLLSKAEKDKQLLSLDSNLQAVSQFVREVEHQILEKNEALKASTNEHRVITLEVGKLEDYRNTLILEYFSRVYKAPANEVLDNWKSLVENNPQVMLNSIARQVKNNPSLLGELKGIGLGKMFGLTKERQGAIAGVEVLNQRLVEYEKSGIKLQELKTALDEGDFINAKEKLGAEIAGLKQLLPNKYEQEFMEKLTALQQSNNFTFEQIAKVVVNDDGRGLVLDYYSRNGQEQSLAKEQEVKEMAKNERTSAADNLVDFAAPEKRARRSRLRNRNVVREAPLTFEQVNKNLTSSHFEQIFRDYALSINNDGGKLRKQGNHLSCGSLSMNLNSGSWNRFSTGDKGDIYGFVEQARGINKKEALEFVAIFAGVEGYKDRGYQQVNAGNLNQQRKEDIAADKPANEWLAVNKVPESAPQFTVSKHLRHMLQEHQCQGTYEYRNVKGELLGYSVRLTETATGDKQVLPVAWCHNAALNKEGWRLKGFSDQGCKPVYGAEKLASSDKPVLIVEGEKTANKAQELLPEYTVLSWLGGSGSADKANWSLCAGKEVVIWPDNDAAGVKAAELIAGKINNLNGYIGMVSVVNPEIFKEKAKIQSLEEGWDLGDKLPAGIEIRDVREVITNTRTTARSIVELEKNLKALEDETKFDAIVSDIASRTYLQKASQGLPVEPSDIVAKAKLEANWQEALSGAESKEYQLYAEARGIKDNPHEFLNINNSKLYRATLSAIAVNKGIEPTNIRENTSRLEQEYVRSRQALYFDPSLQKQHLQQLQSGSVDLYRTLVKDVILLHQIQLDKSLPAVEEQRIVEEAYKIVKPLDNDKELTAAEKVAASEQLFKVINSKERWKESVERQLRVAEEVIGNMRDKVEKSGKLIEIAVGSATEHKVTIITTELEFASTIRQTGVEAKILCSVGAGNIRNYQPLKDEKIIITTDNNDRENDSIKVVAAAAEELRAKGAIVHIITPAEKGGFNDIGTIKERLEPALARIVADTGREWKVNRVAAKYRESNPQQVTMFENEIRLLERLAPDSFEKVLSICEQKGLEQATSEAFKTNEDAVSKHMSEALLNFDWRARYPHKKDTEAVKDFYGNEVSSANELLRAVAQDKDVLRYIDKNDEYPDRIEMITGKALETEGVRLADFSNKYTIAAIAEEHKLEQPETTAKFFAVATELQKFAEHKTEAMLKVYDGNGMSEATAFAGSEVKAAIQHKVNNNLCYLEREATKNNTAVNVWDFNGNNFNNKTDYLLALFEDKQVMKYLEDSSIYKQIKQEQQSKELSQQKEIEQSLVRQKSRGFDFGIGD